MLAAHRDPESYVAGSTYLLRGRFRFSGDIDIFHDREERVEYAAEQDVAALQDAGMRVRWQRREPTFYQALISSGDETTKLEWVVDSDFRFFPAVRDDLFGYVLHPIDLAANKVMAAAGRREPRDIVDVVVIHDDTRPMAGSGKDTGLLPPKSAAQCWSAIDKTLGQRMNQLT